MKKLILSLIMALAAFSTNGQTNDSLFNASETAISLGTGYVLDRGDPFEQDYDVNFIVGLSHYFTKYFGAEVVIPIQTEGIAVSEAQLGLLARLPISFVAPYFGALCAYNWQAQNEVAYIAKLGAEIRFNPKWGIFLEGQYRNNDFNWDKGTTSVASGIKFIF